MKKIYISLFVLISISKYCFAQPSNDNPCFALSLPVVGGTLFDEPCTTGTLYNETSATISSVTYAYGNNCFNGVDAWFTVVVPSSGNLMLNTISSAPTDLTMAIYTTASCSGIFNKVVCNDDGGDETIGRLNPVIRLSGRTPGEILYVAIRPYFSTTMTTFQLCAKNLGTTVAPAISSSGFVGIGISTPEAHLDVNGDGIVRRDLYVGRNSNFYGNATFNGNLTFNKLVTINQDVTMKGQLVVEDSLISQGYTRLGKVTDGTPKIKMKEFNITSGATSNGQSAVNHGLNSTKIISVSVLLEWTAGYLAPPEYSPDPLLNYNYFVSPTQIIVQNNAASCAYICSKPVKILVTYKE
jgi:hypothetical protein